MLSNLMQSMHVFGVVKVQQKAGG